MFQSRGLFILWSLYLDVLHLVMACPYLECSCWDATIDCENLRLDAIPKGNVSDATGFTTLDLSTNQISRIPAGMLPPNLAVIELTRNPVDVIEDSAFDGSASTLKILSFSFAKFTRIPNAFLLLTALEDLTIYDTDIQDWNDAAMQNIGRTITTLTFENVSISTWPTWMTYFSNLTGLMISRSSLSSMPDDALDRVASSLRTLTLSNNSFTEVPKALSKLNKLQTLFLSNNKIIDVKWLPDSRWLVSLRLDNNQISNSSLLSEALLPYGESLTDLNINDNQLTSIPEFDFFSRFGGFDLSHNKISDPLSGKVRVEDTYAIDLSYNLLPKIPKFLSSLRLMNFLVVPHNSIRRIQSTDFSTTVGEVELSFNLITELTDDSFPRTSTIEVIRLNNNPISTISNLAFQHLTGLKELGLQGSKLTRMPLALQYLPGLSKFDMTGSYDLVCTCREKPLGQWFRTQTDQGVLGYCGHVSIYEFFSKLSPSCPD